MTSPQAIGSKPVWVDRSVLWWTLTYQPLLGIDETLLIVVVTLAFPEASAVTVISGYTTGPWLAQLPLWICAACELLGSRLLTVSLTVKVLPESISCAIPLADSPALAFGAVFSGICNDSDDAGEKFVRAISPQAIGKNWSLGERPGPL